METLKTLIKCLLTFVILAIGAFMAVFAFDAPSWITNLTILAVIILIAGTILYFIWKT